MINTPASPWRLRVSQQRQKAIGRELKRLYVSILAEPTPVRFLHLLEKADLMLSRRDGSSVRLAKMRSSGPSSSS